MPWESHTFSTRPMTLEDAFACLVGLRVMTSPNPLIDPATFLSLDMTILDWLVDSDDFNMRHVGPFLNKVFHIAASQSEWKQVLEPRKIKTLRDVCQFIASRAKKREILPLEVLGRPCPPAGAFLAVRSILRDLGVDTTNLRPSSPIELYLTKHAETFLIELSQLSPCSLPPLHIQAPVQNALAFALFTSVLLLAASMCLHNPFFITISVASMILFMLCIAATKKLFPPKIHLGWIKTFKDLSRALVHDSPGPAFPVIVTQS